jgi:lysophospholipase L1-like esterase
MRLPTLPVALLAAALIASPCLAADCEKPNPDWANLAAYRTRNSELQAQPVDPRRVVFMGDSITEFWDAKASNLFATPGFVNRGISGQTTPQMLLRFRGDVIELKPRVVVILAGTNDIAGNTGPATTATIAANIASMAELARSHGIKVVLASVLPAAAFYWAPEERPAARIVELNRWIWSYSKQNRFGYIDYHTAMADSDFGLKKEYSDDGVHPNAAGYTVMNRLVIQALARVTAAGPTVRGKP